MGFASVQEGAYEDTDVEFLQQVGKQVAVAVDNVLHHQDLTHDRDRLRLLLEVSESIASHRDRKGSFAIWPNGSPTLSHSITSTRSCMSRNATSCACGSW